VAEKLSDSSWCVERLRQFNRFYTPIIGVLEKNYLGLGRSLTDVRIIFELYRRRACVARDVAQELRVDAGYLSRTLKRFEREGIVTRKRALADHRRALIHLTAKGRDEFKVVDKRARAAMGEIIERLTPAERRSLVRALDTVQGIVDTSLRRNEDRVHRSVARSGVVIRGEPVRRTSASQSSLNARPGVRPGRH